jgi:hypothetical protein
MRELIKEGAVTSTTKKDRKKMDELIKEGAVTSTTQRA